MNSDIYRKFCQAVIDNIKKHGFPEKKVAFPLEQLYEAAYNKDINFNDVLETLDEIQIAHEKTPEKIVFFPKKAEPERPASNPLEGIADAAGVSPEMFQNMSMPDLMAAARNMMQNVSPEQLKAVKEMYENMSDEERAAFIENAKKMGLF